MIDRRAYPLVRGANALRRKVRTDAMWMLALSLLTGAAAGLGAVLLGQAARGIQRLLFGLAPGEHLSAAGPISWPVLLWLPVGGAILGATIWLFRRRTPIDVVEANALHGGRIPARDTAQVAIQTILSNGFGASVGLEAAYAQAGGGIASLFGQRLKLRRADMRTLVGAGTAAAISATFGAPLTGAFYGFEIVIGAYTPAVVAPVMLSSIAGAFVAGSLGATPYVITAGGMHPIGTIDYLFYAALGVVCALVGIVMMRMVSAIEQFVRRLRVPAHLAPAIGGLVLVPLAVVSPEVLSGGHGALNLNLTTEVTIASLALVIALKLAASALSLGFGFRGGLFFASLFLGSLVGRLFQVALAQVPNLHVLAPDDATVVGMAALAVGVVGAPMTISLLVLEVTHDFAITGVAIAASLVCATLVRQTFGYSFSTWRLHLRGETMRSGRDIGWMRALTAERLMRTDVPCIAASTAIRDFRARFPLGSTTRVVLVDAEGRYAGIVETALAYAPDADLDAAVSTLAALRETSLAPSANIVTILDAFDVHQADDLAVVKPRGKVAGLITERHVRKRYAEEIEKSQRELYGES